MTAQSLTTNGPSNQDEGAGSVANADLKQETGTWEKVIPWFLTISCMLVLISIAWFLINNIIWFKSSAFDLQSPSDEYRIYIYQLHLSMIKRSVGLFSGFAMMFVGASVCFYIVKAKTDVAVKSHTLSLNLATASPGIIAMLLGASLIMFTIASKDDFPGYIQSNNSTLVKPPIPREKENPK